MLLITETVHRRRLQPREEGIHPRRAHRIVRPSASRDRNVVSPWGNDPREVVLLEHGLGHRACRLRDREQC